MLRPAAAAPRWPPPCARPRRGAGRQRPAPAATRASRAGSPARSTALRTPSVDVGHAQRGAGRQRPFGRLREIEGVRPHHQRAAAGRGLDQVLPAQRREAAAEQRHVGQRVVQRHLAQRVAQPDIRRSGRGGRRVGPAAAPQAVQAGGGDHARRPRRSAADGAAPAAAAAAARAARARRCSSGSSSPSRVLAASTTGRAQRLAPLPAARQHVRRAASRRT